MPPEEYDPDEYEDETDVEAEVPFPYLKWRSDPEAKARGFKWITKDRVLANLSEEDLIKIRMCDDLFMQNIALVKDKITTETDIKVANEFLENCIVSICASSVGFKGFGRSLDTTVIQQKRIQREDITKKGKFHIRR